jgi:hypothetical protein
MYIPIRLRATRTPLENELDQDDNYDGTKKVKVPLIPCHKTRPYKSNSNKVKKKEGNNLTIK